MEVYKQFFSRRLRHARKKTPLTQADLGEKVGVEPSTVSRWESGKDMPEDSRLPDIAKHLGVTIEELTGTAPPVASTVGEMTPFELEKMLQDYTGARLKKEEKELLRLFRQADVDARSGILEFARSTITANNGQQRARPSRG